MRKKGVLKPILLCLMCMVLMTGCSNKKIESALNDMKSASNRVAELKSGEFEFTYELNDGDVDAKKANQRVSGSFSVTDKNKVDWVRKIYIADEKVPKAEQKQENLIQYQKIEQDSKKNKWIPINENAVGYPPELEELLNITWKVSDIGKIEKEKQDSNVVIYKLEFSDDFLKHLKQDQINSIQKELKRAKEEENIDAEYLDGLEESIKSYQAINYKQYKTQVTIDGNGVISGYKTEIITADGNEKPELISTIISNVNLDNYNEK